MINTYGNILTYNFAANESENHTQLVTLPDGYSIESIVVSELSNIGSIESYFLPPLCIPLRFPPIRSKSPNTLNIYIIDTSKNATLTFIITKFGQIADPHYFDKEADPILVTGDDGNEYNVIPSDQFK